MVITATENGGYLVDTGFGSVPVHFATKEQFVSYYEANLKVAQGQLASVIAYVENNESMGE